jgi:hypothetical protein
MATVKIGNEMASAFLKATGIPEKYILGVQLHMGRDEIAHISVTRALNAEDLARLAKELECLASAQGGGSGG